MACAPEKRIVYVPERTANIHGMPNGSPMLAIQGAHADRTRPMCCLLSVLDINVTKNAHGKNTFQQVKKIINE